MAQRTRRTSPPLGRTMREILEAGSDRLPLGDLPPAWPVGPGPFADYRQVQAGHAGFFDIDGPNGTRLGHLVVASDSRVEAAQHGFDVGYEYWLWTSGVPWPSAFSLVPAQEGPTYDPSLPWERVPFRAFAEDVVEAGVFALPASPEPGQFYRVRRVSLDDGSESETDVFLWHYLGSYDTGQTRTQDWYARIERIGHADGVVSADGTLGLSEATALRFVAEGPPNLAERQAEYAFMRLLDQ